MGTQRCVRFALLHHTSPKIILKLYGVPYNNKMYLRLLLKWPIFLSDCNHVWIFWTDFHKKNPISNFTKIHPTEAELILVHADGRTGEQRSK
jgi:hypothetical protein